MATRSVNLPIERHYLARAWFVLAAILLAAAVVMTMALAARSTPAGGTGLGPVTGKDVIIALCGLFNKDDGTFAIHKGRHSGDVQYDTANLATDRRQRIGLRTVPVR